MLTEIAISVLAGVGMFIVCFAAGWYFFDALLWLASWWRKR